MYISVIEDVISGVRDIFSDEGLDEQVLQELKILWESKLMASKAIESAQDTIDLKPNEKAKAIANGAVYNGGAVKQQYAKPQPQTVQQPTQMPVQCTSTSIAAEDKMIPIQITLPAQPTIDSVTRVLTIHVPASALNGPQLHTLLTGPVITATMGLPAPLASALLQQHVNAALQNQQAQTQAQAQQVLTLTTQAQTKTTVGIDNGSNNIKLDGPTDTSDEDDEGSEDEASEEEAEDDKEDDDPDVMDDQANEEEPLNSEDDVTDEEPSDLFDTENVVVCQYDKVILKNIYIRKTNRRTRVWSIKIKIMKRRLFYYVLFPFIFAVILIYN